MNDKDREPQIHQFAYVDEEVELGDWSVVHAGVQIDGKVKVGRAAWINNGAVIGGGQRELGSLRTGDFLHMGVRSFINIADSVVLGHEVGLGVETKLYTHGGYLNVLEGFPYQYGPIMIGDEVWLPKATVLPNVIIGSRVVVAAESLVNRNLPSGCLAGGIPVRVIRENEYFTEKSLSFVLEELQRILFSALNYGVDEIRVDGTTIVVGKTRFWPMEKRIEGPADKDTERVKDLFRRNGVRFRYYDNGGEYTEWD